MTGYNSPLLQAMEYVGLYLNEVSHVAQALKAKDMGFDLAVKSPEAALLLQGSAEYFALTAMAAQGATWKAPSPVSLFAAEQAVALVYEEDEQGNGNLFPDTVGFPFVAGLAGLETADTQMDWLSSMLYTIQGVQSLQSWLFARYP